MRHVDNFLSRLKGVRPAGTGWRACCPAHDDTNPTMGVSLGEGNRIIFNCPVCGPSRAAKERILKAARVTWKDLFPKGKDCQETAPIAERVVIALTDAEADLRNTAFSYLAERTGLIEEHAASLQRRGLAKEHVLQDGYFSVERVSQNALGRLLINLGDDLYRVPGFWQDVAGRPRFSATEQGLFVPVRDEHRRIIAAQIRTGGDPKYLWLKGSGCPRHVPLYVEPGPTAWVTEGPLKADIASVLSGFPVVAVAGVSAWRPLLPALGRWGTKRVITAFDADWQTNAAVRDSLEQFERTLRKHGYEVDRAVWAIEKGKGLDDLLAAGFSPTIREVSSGNKFAGLSG